MKTQATPKMKWYKTESEAQKSELKGPVEETNNGFLVFASDDDFLNWLDEVEPMPHMKEGAKK